LCGGNGEDIKKENLKVISTERKMNFITLCNIDHKFEGEKNRNPKLFKIHDHKEEDPAQRTKEHSFLGREI